jgi:16S rRNA (cytidine1402-2'-O)-methyltransferase
MAKGKLYIIPIPISEDSFERVLPTFNQTVVNELRHFLVEKIKTSRQFLRKMNPTFPIDESQFYELNKHDDYSFQDEVLAHLQKGIDVGIMSESGYPGVADPGTTFIALAHTHQIEIVPLIGPSSLLLALACSGMNGQGFTFNGYLPKSESERSQKIKELNAIIQKTGYAQLFIETPFRNEAIFQDVLQHSSAGMFLTIAYDITGSKQFIRTKTIADWKKQPFKFDKTPCVFVLGKS